MTWRDDFTADDFRREDYSTYVEHGGDYFAERPTIELPDLSPGDYEDAEAVREPIPTHDIGEPPW